MELLKLYTRNRDLYKLKIVAGESGICNDVTRIYYIEDTYIADWTRRGELIMTTAMAYHTEDGLLSFVKSFLPYSPSGFIINIGGYIFDIPQSVTDFCNENSLPLLTFPWDIYLQDVMQGFTNMIYMEEHLENNVCEGLKKCLYDSSEAADTLKLLERNGYSGIKTVALGIVEKESGALTESEFAFIKRKFKLSGQKIVFFTDGTANMAVFFNMNCGEISKTSNGILSCCEKIFKSTFFIGVGKVITSLDDLARTAEGALQCAALCGKLNTRVLLFDKLGVMSLIMTCDKALLAEYFDKKLQKIIDYDKKNKTDYLSTLKSFLRCKGNIQLVSEELFLHRNTVNYRMNKLKEMLNTNFDTIDDFVELKIAFYAMDILQ